MNIIIEGMSKMLGGMEVFIMTMCRNLDSSKYHVDFITYDETIACQDELLKMGCEIKYVTPRSVSPKRTKEELDVIFAEKKYDVFWSNKTTISNINALKAAYKAKVPVRVIHSHQTKNMGTQFTLFMHIWNRLFVNKYATKLVACAEEAAVWMFGKNADKAEIIRNGIDLSLYEYDQKREMDIRKKLGLGNEPIVGHVGRMDKQKNHVFLFRVFQEILKKEPSAKLLLCGDGALREQMEEEAKKVGISHRTVFLGIRNDIPEVMQAMNVYVFPSLYEAYPISLIEAQAAGIPCFVSKEANPESMRLSKNIQFISLKETAQVWAEKVLAGMHLKKESDISDMEACEVSTTKMMEKISRILG